MARESKFTKKELYNHTRSILFNHGYDGFHFGLLAEQLDVTRSALYKYYRNKDELITDFMLFEMEQFLTDLEKINEHKHFETQLEYLLQLIFTYQKIHQILLIIYQIPKNSDIKVRENINKLESQHDEMYVYLNQFIQLGRKEGKLKAELPDEMILGFIFQTVNIPNYSNLPEEKWRELLKDFLTNGMYEVK